ncbi:MAG: hypothetical protein IPJ98_26235 [Bryobacterales bacterium]|nr:hypothetical protein [Bryobacterales bacterium]
MRPSPWGFNRWSGLGRVDADGDGFVNELTKDDVTAATLFRAVMAAPGAR